MFGLFWKKYERCRDKIGSEQEVKRDVKVPGLIGTKTKSFCSQEYGNRYEQEVGTGWRRGEVVGALLRREKDEDSERKN